MVPSMAGFIMRRRWQAAIRPTHLPIWLSFQVSTVTGGTVFQIDVFTSRNLSRISGISLSRLRLTTNTAEKSCHDDRGNSNGKTDDDDDRLH